jgi:glycosyltransferase involved in cell wall biosynthesis
VVTKKIVFISKSLSGGAGIASQRLFDCIPSRIGPFKVNKQFVSLNNSSKKYYQQLDYSDLGIISKVLRKVRQVKYRKQKQRYLYDRPPGLEAFQIIDHYHYLMVFDADIIHLHWVSDMFDLSSFLKKISKKTKIIISLHDQSMLTGGCPYTLGCKAFENSCQHCPQLRNPNSNDLASRNFKMKKDLFASSNIYFVANSKYIEATARKSNVIPVSANIETIYFGCDTYKPLSFEEISEFKNEKGIFSDRLIFLAGADFVNFRRKGFSLLKEAFKQVHEKELPFQLVTFGNDSEKLDWEFEHISLGYLKESELLKLYQSADYLIFPSIEEAFGLICQEALASGLPVIGFKNGSIEELIADKINGFIVQRTSAIELAKVIKKLIISDDIDHAFLRKMAKESIKDGFNSRLTYNKYFSLYLKLLSQPQ